MYLIRITNPEVIPEYHWVWPTNQIKREFHSLRGQSDSTDVKALALHAANPHLTTCGLPRTVPGHSEAEPGITFELCWAQKQNQRTTSYFYFDFLIVWRMHPEMLRGYSWLRTQCWRAMGTICSSRNWTQDSCVQGKYLLTVLSLWP